MGEYNNAGNGSSVKVLPPGLRDDHECLFFARGARFSEEGLFREPFSHLLFTPP
jgi:hypothetical protein